MDYYSELKNQKIPLSTIKWISETNAKDDSVGFTFKDFAALYGEKILDFDNGLKYMMEIKKIMSKLFSKLTDEEMSLLDKIGISAWDFIQANSGGHKCITNISGLNFLKRSKRPPISKYRGNDSSGETYYVSLLKNMQNDFVEILQEKINQSKD